MAGNVELIKEQSRGLRGTIEQSIDDKLTGQLAKGDQVLIKFHGSYQQDDRDRRDIRERKKLERAYSFMIRLRIPAGDITAKQFCDLMATCDHYGTGVLKITTRQTVQIHGILKAHLKPTMQDFDKTGLDSIAGCGDVNRNVMASAYPHLSVAHSEVFDFAAKISEALMPTSQAYSEIWLDGEKLSGEAEHDPLYKTHYLPRKFKIGIAIPPHNECDIFTQDIGLIAVIEDDKLLGFNIAAGGGMGTTHGNVKTYPRLATIVGFVTPDRVIDTCAEILMIQRDFGNRKERTFARLKYTIDKMGVDHFKAELEKRLGVKLGPAKPFRFTRRGDIFDIVRDSEGLSYYTLYVEHGRIVDLPHYKIKTALLEIAAQSYADIRFTGNQNIMLTHVKEIDKPKIEAILEKYGIWDSRISRTRQDALACVALNTCPLAMAEAQRYLPSLLTKIDALQAKYNLSQQAISVRMTGCPNGCARPYAAEIAFVGKAMGRYDMRLGGDHLGQRLNKIFHEGIDEAEILKLLDGYFSDYATDRRQHEAFGDYIHRMHMMTEKTGKIETHARQLEDA
ncbi:MAG: NADPH-dependent assimilatory sulfite reductase hemoprotein subunit [Pseudomonadota bacterium]